MLEIPSHDGVSFLIGYMEKGRFCFLSDDYFIKFQDTFLIRNKESINGAIHDRPCFYALEDKTTGLFWMIHFSSQTSKYRSYYNQKVTKYKQCDTIAFSYIMGHEKAFLIQNMCPVAPKYIKNVYIDLQANIPIKVDGVFERDLVKKAKKVLALQRKGIKLIFPDVLEIERQFIIGDNK